jgi:tRNA U34 2-thiouridine synthase MnmA/TrmU
MKKRALTLLSGGLDSLLASRIVLEEGIELIGVHFTSPLCNGIDGDRGEKAVKAAAELGIKIIVQDKGDAYLDIVKHPKHGYGKNMNPCIDCRIYMLGMTRRLMESEQASFVVTGEVVGQRPMSQKKETIQLIERESGFEGLILRPLSAKLFPLTLPEQEGIIDRNKLLSINGRSRQSQYLLVERYGLKEFAKPGGGCLLTDMIFSRKLKELLVQEEACSMTDAALIRVGRHFRFEGTKFVLGRNKEENEYLHSFFAPPYSLVCPDGFKGPTGITKGNMGQKEHEIVGNIMAYYGKNNAATILFDVHHGSKIAKCAVEKRDIDPEKYRIKEA